MEDIRFYINLPVTNTDQSIGALVQHAYNQLLNDVNHKSFSLNQFMFVSSYNQKDSGSIYIDYDVSDQDLIESANEDNKEIDSSYEAIFATGENIYQSPNSCTIRMKTADIDDVDNKLLIALLNFFNHHGTILVKDMVYHSLMNDDGQDTPDISIYF